MPSQVRTDQLTYVIFRLYFPLSSYTCSPRCLQCTPELFENNDELKARGSARAIIDDALKECAAAGKPVEGVDTSSLSTSQIFSDSGSDVSSTTSGATQSTVSGSRSGTQAAVTTITSNSPTSAVITSTTGQTSSSVSTTSPPTPADGDGGSLFGKVVSGWSIGVASLLVAAFISS